MPAANIEYCASWTDGIKMSICNSNQLLYIVCKNEKVTAKRPYRTLISYFAKPRTLYAVLGTHQNIS